MRDRNDGPRRTIPHNLWKIVEGTHLSLEGGFDPGKIYELVYTAKDPALVGLGPAAIRDLISSLQTDDQQYQARLRLRIFAKRPLPAHISLLRLQRR